MSIPQYQNFPHNSRVDGSLELESDPVGPYDAVTKRYLDAVSDDHVSSDIGAGAGPTVSVRMGLRAAFVTWSGVGSNVSGHGYYQVQMATDAAFLTIVDDVVSKTNWAVFDGLDTTVSYWWRVRGVDAAGNTSDWTTTAATDTPDEVITDDLEDLVINIDKNATVVDYQAQGDSANNFSVTNTSTSKVSIVFSVPSWAGDTTIAVMGSGQFFADNGDQGYGYLKSDIAGATSVETITPLSTDIDPGADAFLGTIPTYKVRTGISAPGSTVTCNALMRQDSAGVWSNSPADNRAALTGLAMFSR